MVYGYKLSNNVFLLSLNNVRCTTGSIRMQEYTIVANLLQGIGVTNTPTVP